MFNVLFGLAYSLLVATIIAIETFLTALYVIVKDTIEGIIFIVNLLAKWGCKNGK